VAKKWFREYSLQQNNESIAYLDSLTRTSFYILNLSLAYPLFSISDTFPSVFYASLSLSLSLTHTHTHTNRKREHF
jgi:hypothetical protein